jgi:hypothetical protein
MEVSAGFDFAPKAECKPVSDQLMTWVTRLRCEEPNTKAGSPRIAQALH